MFLFVCLPLFSRTEYVSFLRSWNRVLWRPVLIRQFYMWSRLHLGSRSFCKLSLVFAILLTKPMLAHMGTAASPVQPASHTQIFRLACLNIMTTHNFTSLLILRFFQCFISYAFFYRTALYAVTILYRTCIAKLL